MIKIPVNVKHMKEINIILANAPINDINRGCVALTISSIYLIDRVCKEEKIPYKLFLPNSGLSIGNKYSLPFGNHNIEFYTFGYTEGPGKILSLKIIINELLKHKYFENLKVFKHADIIFDIGLGDSFSDIYGKDRFAWINLIHKMARKYKKKYCFLPQTIGPFVDNNNIRQEAITSLVGSKYVMARDRQSFNFVQKNAKSQHNVKEYIDVAFFLPYKKMQFDKNCIHVGINISSMLWEESEQKNNNYGLKIDYKESILSIIDYFLSFDNVQVHLVPHVVNGSRFSESDYSVSYDLWDKLANTHVTLAPFFLGPIEAKNYISGLDFFVGARMHATIAAFSSNVPVIPMAYSRKFNGLFIDTLGYNHIVDMKKDTMEGSLNIIKDAFESRGFLFHEIKRIMNTTVDEKKKQLMVDLKKIIRK